MEWISKLPNMERFKKDKKICTLLILISTCCTYITSQAQPTLLCKETYNWYFGNAGITFNSGIPVALTNTAMNASEGCASISDENGNLLMYTNGINVWDSTHSIMPNGSGLAGSTSSAQSAIIVPLPSSDSLYYIFTVKDWKTDQFGIGFNYSIVNIDTAGNGSLSNPFGDVITKNIPIDSNVREQVTAVYHANCQDIWIITHRGSEWHTSDSYLSYLLTDSGLNMVPVISNTGMTYSTNNRYGYLKPSHDGKKICSTLGRGASYQGTTIEILDFNNTSGVLSNPIIIADSGSIDQAYSSEFSPDNSILYSVAHNGDFIYQFDLSSGIQSTIAASKTNIATGNATKSCLQLGPDDKIYVSRDGSQFLGVINNPNSLGNCNYVDQGVNLPTGNTRLGLPTFWKRQYIHTIIDTILCMGDSIMAGGEFQNVTGTYADTLFGSNICDSCYHIITTILTVLPSSDTIQNITLCDGQTITVGSNNYNTTGTYWDTTTAINGCDSVITTILTVLPQIGSTNTLSICNGDSIEVGGNSYNTTGIYNDLFTATNGCDSTLTTDLTVLPTLSITQNFNICDGDSIIIGGNTYSTTGIFNDTFPAANGCDSIFTTDLSFLPTSSNTQNITLCEGQTIIVGSNTYDTTGTYTDTLSAINGCDSIVISILMIYDIPDIQLTNDTTIMLGTSVNLLASGGMSYLWSTGEVGNNITVSPLQTTIYSVTTTDTLSCTNTKTVTITISDAPNLYVPNIFSPASNHPDNDKLHVYGKSIEALEFSIFDRWGTVVFQSIDASATIRNDGHCCKYGKGWNGTYENNGKKLNSGVFAYKLTGHFLNGEEFFETGNITLIW